jgi:hypothetical protein
VGAPCASVYVLTYGPSMYFGGSLTLRARDNTFWRGDDAAEVKMSSSVIGRRGFKGRRAGRKVAVEGDSDALGFADVAGVDFPDLLDGTAVGCCWCGSLDIPFRPVLRGGEVPDLGGVGSCEIWIGGFFAEEG